MMTRHDTRLAVTLGLTAWLMGACRTAPPAPTAELPALDITSWTEKTELYMEHPPLVAAQTAPFAVHLTTLADFKAMTTGRPHLELTPETGGSATVLLGTEALRPGAFRVEGTLPAAGRYRWALVVDAPDAADRHDLGTITVFPDEATALAAAEKQPPADPSAFAYLKEQQWTNAFATDRVRTVELRSAARTPASIEPLAGGEAVVAAPAAGRFLADALIAIGASVQAGQVLGRLEPRLAGGDDRATLAATVSEARATLESARAEQSRSEQLLAQRALPARRVDEARRAVGIAEARLQAAEARLAQRDETLRSGGGASSGNAFALRAPISGRIAAVMATLGASYDEGAPLFRIVRTDRVELRAQIPAADAASARNVTELAFEVAGREEPILLHPRDARDAGIVDPTTLALPVLFDVENPDGQLLVGQTGTALLYQRDRVRGLGVPKAAVLLEGGRPYVFVQVGGERFVRRYIDITARDGDWIGLRAGLVEGDRVVTRGAYDVQLASAAKGLPAEGHVH
ncbi:MAG: efflux RND transporter periplasmic adaptor subunit [Vicinamibacterales bacterium]